jgi:hypothetical protein
MSNSITLLNTNKLALLREIKSSIDKGYIPVGNLETIQEEDTTTPTRDIEYEDFSQPSPYMKKPETITKFTQEMYKPTLTTKGGSYKNKTKKYNKSK